MQFEIFTDSSCDLSKEIIDKYDIKVMQLEVLIDNNPPVLNNQVKVKWFYDMLRAGSNAKTAAVTPGYFEEHMRKCLEEGKDILYIGFSSGLSVTYNNGVMVINELQGEYPDCKLYSVDTLCASVGQGLLVYWAALMRESGMSIEKVHQKIMSKSTRIAHQVTVDDLFFLKRGGRISATAAIAGSVLKFKPIIIVDNAGHLINVGKVRGRKTSLHELVKRMKEGQRLDEFGHVFISHSDCLDDANLLAELIKEEMNPEQIHISDIGPVVGAHTGPGALALCYLAESKE